MKNLKGWLAAVAGFAPLAAFAEVPAGVTTAITAAQTNGELMGAAVLVAIVTLFGIKLLRKAL